MKPTPLLFTGIIASFAAAWLGLIVTAHTQIGELAPEVDTENETVYPRDVAGITEQGRRVYIANGCNQCHTQMVRDPHHGRDIGREWGPRRTVPRDYLFDNTAVLGTLRIGPDLSNVGAPQEENSRRRYLKDPQWLLHHLYNPRTLVPASNMPAYRFLFEKREIVGQRSDNALALAGTPDDPGPDHEIVPTHDAKALVAYLMSLDKSFPLSEAAGKAPAAPAAPAEAAK